MKQKITILIIILIAINNFCFAEEVITKEITHDKRVSVYWHPGTIAISTLTLMLDGYHGNRASFILYTTIEKPLSLSNSLIIRPSIIYNSKHSFLKSGRVGSDIGMRYYPSEKGKGLYIAGQTGLFYYAIPDKYPWNHIDNKQEYIPAEKKMWFDAMGYIGVKTKRIYFDVGVGFSNIKTDDDERGLFIPNNSNFLFDINFGVRF